MLHLGLASVQGRYFLIDNILSLAHAKKGYFSLSEVNIGRFGVCEQGLPPDEIEAGIKVIAQAGARRIEECESGQGEPFEGQLEGQGSSGIGVIVARGISRLHVLRGAMGSEASSEGRVAADLRDDEAPLYFTPCHFAAAVQIMKNRKKEDK